MTQKDAEEGTPKRCRLPDIIVFCLVFGSNSFKFDILVINLKPVYAPEVCYHVYVVLKQIPMKLAVF